VFRIERYAAAHAAAWDGHVARAKNGLFLFNRGYMDYHADRFSDHSLCVLRDDTLFALIPACEREGEFLSHGGLTFGGVLSDERMKTPHMLDIFALLREYLRAHRFTSCVYKSIPCIYHTIPAQEDSYALFSMQATLVKCEVSSTIRRAHSVPYSERRARGIRKARKLGLTFARSWDYARYFALVGRMLEERHGARPTHTAEEMELLAGRFPEHIALWTAQDDSGEMLAGVIMYLHTQVAHAQYIAASPAGRECGALDALFDHLLTDVYREQACFDFGISTEQSGRHLNTGLITQKEEFGARAVVHETWQWNIG
jgi:hypothetical protein